MGLFSPTQIEQINKAAEKSLASLEPVKNNDPSKMGSEIREMSEKVIEYFQDSPSILIETAQQLEDYVDEAIRAGYCGIDTETTGLDRIKDYVVGASLYYPGGNECYIPMKHMVPIFEQPYKGQLTYEEVQHALQKFVTAGTKMIFANADFDLAMIYKDLHVDMNDICYFDVLLAWRCLKENEPHNDLKTLYNKYCLRGKGDPKKFTDFFTPALFPYCKPQVAKLYAANDAKITYELFKFELQYLTPSNPKCQKSHLEKIASLVWDVEFPLIKICQNMHRTGIYLDQNVANTLRARYQKRLKSEQEKLAGMIDEIISETDYSIAKKRPFNSGKDFNVNSTTHMKYLVYEMMKVPSVGGKKSTSKEVIGDLNLPVTNQILKIRSLLVLINTFVEKLPKAITPDGRIHAQFKQIGAATGRFSCIAEGQLVNTPDGFVAINQLCKGDTVYCIDEAGNLTTRNIIATQKTGYRECVRIVVEDTDTGLFHEIICTPEHPIRGSDGNWYHAEDVKLGQSLKSMKED